MAASDIVLFRIGSVQALVRWTTEEGLHRRLIADFSRVHAEGADPKRPWEMEEILAVASVCKRIEDYALNAQTMVVVEKPPEKPGE